MLRYFTLEKLRPHN